MFQYYWVNTGHFLKIPVLLGKSSITGAVATLNFLLTFFVKRRRASCVRLKSVSSFTTWTKFVQNFS